MFRGMRRTGLAALAAVSCATAGADDVAITLAPGGSFIVKSPTGDQVLLSVDPKGALKVNGRHADFTPPTIEVDAPEIATSSYTEYTVRLADDVGLALAIEGVTKTHQYTNALYVQLTNLPQIATVSATDTSGNFSKISFAVRPPEIPLQVGLYRILGDNSIPDGFNCSEVNFNGQSGYALGGFQDGGSFNDGFLQENGIWSQSEGYAPFFSLTEEDQGSGGNAVLAYPSNSIPLQSTEFGFATTVASGGSSEYYFSIGFQGQLRSVSGEEPPRLELDVEMTCDFSGSGQFKKGTAASYLLEFVEASD